MLLVYVFFSLCRPPSLLLFLKTYPVAASPSLLLPAHKRRTRKRTEKSFLFCLRSFPRKMSASLPFPNKPQQLDTETNHFQWSSNSFQIANRSTSVKFLEIVCSLPNCCSSERAQETRKENRCLVFYLFVSDLFFIFCARYLKRDKGCNHTSGDVR